MSSNNKKLKTLFTEDLQTKNLELTKRNEYLSSELNKTRKRLQHIIREKRILLDKLLQYDGSVSDILLLSPSEDVNMYNDFEEQEMEETQAIELSTARSSDSNSVGSKRKDSNSSSISSPPFAAVTATTSTTINSSRPKRMRKDPVESKLRRVQPLEKTTNGQYKLPVRVGIITVHSLGKVIPKPTYHNDRYIWPPGFTISRTYLSMINPNANTTYTCSVEENGDQGPKFRIVAEDCPNSPIIANSATGVWSTIVKVANEIRHREHSNSASGPDYYGFTHATIAKMIQDLPGADQCKNYVWQKFDIMKERTAAGVIAAAQKKMTNLCIMGSANKKPSKADLIIHGVGYDNSNRLNTTGSSQQQEGSNSRMRASSFSSSNNNSTEDPTPLPSPSSPTAYYKKKATMNLYDIMNSADTESNA